MRRAIVLPAVLSLLLAPLAFQAGSAAGAERMESVLPAYAKDWGLCGYGFDVDVQSLRVTRTDPYGLLVEMSGTDPFTSAPWSITAVYADGRATGEWSGADACGNAREPIDEVHVSTFDCAAGRLAVYVDTVSSTHQYSVEGAGTCAGTSGPGGVGVGGVQVDPPGATLLAVTLVGLGASPVGCAGTVQVEFTSGASLALPGYRLSPDGCAAPPCDPWTGLPTVRSCGANPLGCCTTLYAGTTSTQAYACLRATFVRVDVNGDGVWDVVAPAATVTNPPC